ncbi:MAG: hypothetical protein EA388_13525 [Nitriliruptor sp.]|nr:MAG: hypothetical protein EA388_13525 [Nitriliruptor sp.]
MKTMAVLLRDPNPIHYDVDAVRAAGLGDRVVNQGPSNLGYVVNMLLAWTGNPASILQVSARFLGNVFAGDAVTAGGAVREVTSDHDGPVAVCGVWLDRDDGTRLVSGSARVRPPFSAEVADTR